MEPSSTSTEFSTGSLLKFPVSLVEGMAPKVAPALVLVEPKDADEAKFANRL